MQAGVGGPYPHPHAVGYGPPLPVARPRGVPSRTSFLVGAVGHFMAAGASITYGIALLLTFYMFLAFTASILGIVLAVILFVSLLLHLFGFYGFWRNYGSTMAAATFAYGLVATILYLVASVLSLFAFTVECTWAGCYPVYSLWGVVLVIVSYVMLGVMFIVEGAAYIVLRRFTTLPGAAVASGVLFIIGGSFVTSILLAIFGGFFVLAPALIIGGIVLTKTPVPRLPLPQAPPPLYAGVPPPPNFP